MSLADLRPYLDARLSTLPFLVVHATEACDSRCVGCSYGRAPGPTLTLAAARALAADADRLGTRAVLVTGGEPLLVPHLPELVAPFRRPGRRLLLATSGTLLEARAELVSETFHEVFVSLDGPDARTHDGIRGVPTFDALARGVAAVKMRRPIPFTARATVSRLNADRVADIGRTARRLGIDNVSFLPVDAWSTAFGRHGGELPGGLQPTLGQVEALEGSLEALEAELGPAAAKDLRFVAAHLRASLGKGPWPFKRCNTPHMSAVVEAGGLVRPCFFKAALGSVPARTLGDVLQGPEAVALRRSLRPMEDPDCVRCVCPKYFPLRDLLTGRAP